MRSVLRQLSGHHSPAGMRRGQRVGQVAVRSLSHLSFALANRRPVPSLRRPALSAAASERWRHSEAAEDAELGDWTLLPNGVRMQVLERSTHDERPVTQGQTVRIAYVVRLDDGTECARAQASFRLGRGAVCEALDQGVVGMCVGDVRRLRASGYMRRGPALAAAPEGEILEYEVQLTGAVHHMEIVTIPKPGSDDPLQMMWEFSRRSLMSVISGKKPTSTRNN